MYAVKEDCYFNSFFIGNEFFEFLYWNRFVQKHGRKKVVSPNGKLKVILYNRGCGATVGFITGITILKSDEKLSDEDNPNVVLAENAVRKYWKDDNQNLVKGNMNFDAKWINDNELLVYYIRSEFITKRDKFENIEIRYELIK